MIPRSVKIGNVTYSIEKANHPLVLNGQENSGQIDYRNTLIKIREDGFSEQHQEETFWHEVMHAIIDREGLKFDDEELVCNSFGKAIHALMRDNPLNLPGQDAPESFIPCISRRQDAKCCNTSDVPPEAAFKGVPSCVLVEEIVLRGHATKHHIPPDAEYSLRSHSQYNTFVHSVGNGPVLFLAVID